MRKSTGILIASGLVLSLAACAAPTGPAIDGGVPVSAASCTPIWERGGLAADVEASGDFGATPAEADFPLPLVSHDGTSSRIVSVGDGPVIGPTDVVAGKVTVLDGATGEVLTGTQSTIYVPLGAASPILDGAACATVGSRVAAVGTSAALLGASVAVANGLDPEATIVTVVDVEGAYLSRARGGATTPQNGLPSVSLTAEGRPGLSFTNAPAPTELRIETLVQGTGSVVAEGDSVLLHYTGVIWDSHDVFDSSWESGTPRILATSGVIPGFAEALVGARVGSQVLAAIPPADGYGDSPPSGSGIAATDTLVFVIDILGVVPAQ